MFEPLSPPIDAGDYAATFGHACGQRVLKDIADGFHVFDAMFTTGTDPLELAWREGQRSVALWLLSRAEAALLNPQEVQQFSTDTDG